MGEHFVPRLPQRVPITLPATAQELGITRSMSRGSAYRRTSVGLFVPSTVPLSVEQRIAEEWTRVGPDAVVTGWAALRLARAAYFDDGARDGWGRPRGGPSPKIHLLVPTGAHPRSNFRSRVTRVTRLPRTWDRDGLRVVHPLLAMFDLAAATEQLPARVVAVDMAIAAGLFTVEEWRAFVDSAPRRLRGVQRARDTVEWCRDRTRSPFEAVLLTIWLMAGLPEPVVNCDLVGERGEFLGTPDLLDEELGLAIEFDGAAHRDPDRHAHDSRRMGAMRNAGLDYEMFVGRDLYDTRQVVRRLMLARARAKSTLAARARAWYLR